MASGKRRKRPPVLDQRVWVPPIVLQAAMRLLQPWYVGFFAVAGPVVVALLFASAWEQLDVLALAGMAAAVYAGVVLSTLPARRELRVLHSRGVLQRGQRIRITHKGVGCAAGEIPWEDVHDVAEVDVAAGDWGALAFLALRTRDQWTVVTRASVGDARYDALRAFLMRQRDGDVRVVTPWNEVDPRALMKRRR